MRNVTVFDLENAPAGDTYLSYPWTTCKVEGGWIGFTGYINEPALQGKMAARYLAKQIARLDGPDLDSALCKIDGHFAFIHEDLERLVASVDRIRSSPLFYYETSGKLYVDVSAERLRNYAGLSREDIDTDGAFLVAMSGYTLGNHTLYRGLNQLRAGQALVVTGRYHEVRHWYRYRPWLVDDTYSETERISDAQSITFGIFEKLAKSASGRPILVPLSAGLDSRLIAAGLKEVGYENIQCFSYGLPGNFEAVAGRRVARQLGYPWFFIPCDHRVMRKHYRSVQHDQYHKFADTCLSVPVEHEYAVCAELRAQGWGPEAIIVNGQSGDFLVGGHVPKNLVGGLSDEDNVAARREAILNPLIEKHFSLWRGLHTSDNLRRVESLIWEELESIDPFSRPASLDYGLGEWLEWDTRQSRYVVTNQRIYEYFGFDWRLPLWDCDYMDFWERVPPWEKLGQNLYKTMLQDADWGRVWRNFSADQWVSPRWLRLVRPVLKSVVGGVGGRNAWRRFDKRYLAYWNDVQGKIAVASWSTVATDRRGWRNAVSWLAEAYLARHGINWNGWPSR